MQILARDAVVENGHGASHNRFVHEAATLAVLDLQDPKIGIELHLFFEIAPGAFAVAAFAERRSQTRSPSPL